MKYNKYIHIDFIESGLHKHISKEGALVVGNNLNEYMPFKKIEKYANTLKKRGVDRTQNQAKTQLLVELQRKH